MQMDEAPMPSQPHWFDYLVIFALTPLCFLMAPAVFEPDWQKGLEGLMGLLLMPASAWGFWLLLGFTGGSFLALRQPSIPVWAHWGLISGGILGLHFHTVLALCFANPTTFSFYLFYFFVPLLAGILYTFIRNRPKWFVWGLGILVFLSLFFIVVSTLGLIHEQNPALIFLFTPILAPSWFAIVCFRLAYKAWQFQSPQQLWLWALGWFVFYGGVWYMAWQKAVEQYAQLPTEPPDCYIATAAAQGSPSVVKSNLLYLENGAELHINTQLQVFKIAELGLKTGLPSIHQALRWIYDGLGRPMALLIRHSTFLSNLTYWLLKPIEYLTLRFLFWCAPKLLKLNVYGQPLHF